MSDFLPANKLPEEDILKCTACSGEVVDAVLLRCLHSACRTCMAGNVSTGVTCPTCKVTTDASTYKTNLLVSSLVHRALLLKDVFTCTQCIDKENEDATAVTWCYTCQLSLCIKCQQLQRRIHSTHRVMHLNEGTNLSELYRPLAPPCLKHNEGCKLACFTCKVGRCYKCAHDCYTSSHDILPFDSPDAIKRMSDSVTHATNVLSNLNSTQTLLQAHCTLPENVLRAREESLSILKKSKTTAIECINSAYEKATESLLDCWDSLLAKSLFHREKIEGLKTKIFWNNNYFQLALNSCDLVGLFYQLDDVLSSFYTCLEEASHFKDPVDPTELVALNTWLPNDLDSIACGWFGSASVVSEDFNCSPKASDTQASIDYYKRKVATLKELEVLIRNLREEQAIVQSERQEMAKLQSEVAVKDEQLVAKQNEAKKLLDQNKEQQQQLDQLRMAMRQLELELELKALQLGENYTDDGLNLSTEPQFVTSQNDTKKLLDRQKKQQQQLEREQRTVAQLQSELQSQTQQLDATQNEVIKLLDQRTELQQQFESEHWTVSIDSINSVTAVEP